MRIHLTSLPHTQTTNDYSWCAYTDKVRKFAGMMTSLGHTVFLYAGEHNHAPCTEHIPIITDLDQRALFPGYNPAVDVFNRWSPADPCWQLMNQRAAAAIQARAHPGDYVGLISGDCQASLAGIRVGGQRLVAVEWGVGYAGVVEGTHRCYESHAWAHHVAGLRRQDEARLFDTVIPNSFELAQFPEGRGGEHFAFLGRLMRRKGPQIAGEACRHLGAKLLMAGQGLARQEPGLVVAQDGTEITGDVEHVGRLGPEDRAAFLGSARAVFVPTTYLEPFGGVAVEAMLCGTPVITTDWGAFTETVIHGVTGFRCRTLAEFVRAGKDAGGLDRAAIRRHAKQYTTDYIKHDYDRWFKRLATLWGEGWYALDPSP